MSAAAIDVRPVEHTRDGELARCVAAVLAPVLARQRVPFGARACAAGCSACIAPHLAKVARAISTGRPITFVLPSFPAKSPSPRKVLGELPDMAEELALEGLEALCAEIARVHAPGARLIVASDGRVFADVVGVSDDAVTRYRDALRARIRRLDISLLAEQAGARGVGVIPGPFAEPSLPPTPSRSEGGTWYRRTTGRPKGRAIELFDLDDAGLTREELLARYAETPEAAHLRARGEDRAMWNGIHRFLFEDRLGAEPGLSRNQLRARCAPLADELLRRSAAWSRFVAERFPDAIRLSIHPQPAHAPKLGIRLGGEGTDPWRTPWHSVAVLEPDGWRLRPRHEAETAGARLVFRGGRPSHFVAVEPVLAGGGTLAANSRHTSGGGTLEGV